MRAEPHVVLGASVQNATRCAVRSILLGELLQKGVQAPYFFEMTGNANLREARG